MKKLATLLLAAGMVVSASAPASAVDVKADAQFLYSFTSSSQGFNGDNKELLKQRVRLGLSMAASENLAGYIQFQLLNNHKMGDTGGTHGDNDITVRQMYMDWIIPGTSAKVRMGRQLLGLPADAFGCNAVIDAGWGAHDGIVATTPVNDWLGLTALWTRTGYDAQPAGALVKDDIDQNASNDFYAVVADMKFTGVNVAVYGAYATLDDSFDAAGVRKATFVGSDGLPLYAGKAWWIGATSTFSMFDPFTFKLSAAYGSYEADKDSKNDQDGWNVQAKASYAMDFGTPVLGAFYFSGDDKDERGTMPSVCGYFAPTRTYHDGSFGLNGGMAAYLPNGNWGVQAGIEGMSFLNGLSHDFLVTYMQGTNDKDSEFNSKDGYYLTEDDSLVSIDFLSYYQLYKNLTACLELSYIISDFDSNYKDAATGMRLLDEDDWRAELSFEYKF